MPIVQILTTFDLSLMMSNWQFEWPMLILTTFKATLNIRRLTNKRTVSKDEKLVVHSPLPEQRSPKKIPVKHATPRWKHRWRRVVHREKHHLPFGYGCRPGEKNPAWLAKSPSTLGLALRPICGFGALRWDRRCIRWWKDHQIGPPFCWFQTWRWGYCSDSLVAGALFGVLRKTGQVAICKETPHGQ